MTITAPIPELPTETVPVGEVTFTLDGITRTATFEVCTVPADGTFKAGSRRENDLNLQYAWLYDDLTERGASDITYKSYKRNPIF